MSISYLAKRIRSIYRDPVAQNVAWLFADRLQKLVIGLTVGIWLARYLGPESFGQLSFAIALVAIVASFAGLGLDLVVVREVVKRPAAKHVLLGTAFWVRTGGALISVIVALALAAVLLPVHSPEFFLIVLVGISLLAKPFDVIDFFFQSQVQSKYAVLAKGAGYFLATALRVTFILIGAPLLAFGLLVSIEGVLTAIALYLFYAKQGHAVSRWRFRPKVAWSLLKAGLPGVGSAISVVLYLKLDMVMLGKLASAHELGNYAVAVRLSEVTYFLPVIITASVLPSLVELRRDDSREYSRKLQVLYDLMLATGLMLVLPFSLLAPSIVALLYGPSYELAGEVLRLYSWSFVFIALSVTTGKWLYAENLIPYNFYLQSIGAVANVSLNLFLIPSFGAKGAALATLVSYAVASYLALLPFPLMRPAVMRINKAMLFPVRYLRHCFAARSGL